MFWRRTHASQARRGYANKHAPHARGHLRGANPAGWQLAFRPITNNPGRNFASLLKQIKIGTRTLTIISLVQTPPQYLDRTLQEENDCHGGCHGVDFATLMVVVHPDSDAAASVEIPYIMLLCFFLVGLAPWTIPNALFAEIPSLAHDVPEGAAIGAWASIAIQISNIGSFAFFIAQRCSNKPIRPERVVAVVISHSHTRTLSYGT